MTINYTTPPLDQSSLEAAAAATAAWPQHCGYYSAVYYNLETGFVWTTDESDSSLGRIAAGIKDNYTVVVRRQDVVENGQIAVCLIDGEEATLKRFSQEGNIVTLMPQSTNPVHKPFVYNLNETSVTILGLVVEVKFSVE